MAQLLQSIPIDILLIIAPLVYIKVIEQKKIGLQYLGFPKKTSPLKSLFLSLKIFGALIVVSAILSLALGIAGLNDYSKVESAIMALVSSGTLVIAYFFIVRIFAEELFFRAFLVPRIGVLGSSAAFAVSHFTYGSIVEVIGAFVLGFVLAHYYSKEKQLMPNYLAHFLYNVFSVAIALHA